ncbi:biogenesis of lysosome-related organelles complex 1 subunit 2-like [Petaurus breviceps papuanus]|uniref:biogenesis of lysosome-related organelles complex 1 subunit 2-like n=1 Tax=Petaurus breviceps papuanus TaxID=3040969 RepID=UPI0036DBC1BC
MTKRGKQSKHSNPTLNSFWGDKKNQGIGQEVKSKDRTPAPQASKKRISCLKDTVSKMAMYLMAKLTATSEDYELLENMNKMTSLKYLEMKDISVNLSRSLKDLNQKYSALQPYLDQITLIREQIAAFEQAAYKLDAYLKKLEAKYKKLERQ